MAYELPRVPKIVRSTVLPTTLVGCVRPSWENSTSTDAKWRLHAGGTRSLPMRPSPVRLRAEAAAAST